MVCGLLVSGSSWDDTQDFSNEGFSSNVHEFKSYGSCQVINICGRSGACSEPGHLGFLVGGFFHSGLESVILCLCAHAKQAFTSAYVEESGVNLLERPLSRRPQGQQAEVDRAPVQGTHPVMSRAPITSRAQCISFQGSLSLPRPGGRHGGRRGLHKAGPPHV